MDSDWEQKMGTVLYVDMATGLMKREGESLDVHFIQKLVSRAKQQDYRLDIHKVFRDGETTLWKLASSANDEVVCSLIKSL